MNTKNLIGGLIAGVALGAAAGLLLAPASGQQTRKKLLKGSRKMKKNVVDYVEHSIDTLQKQFNNKIEQVTGLVKGNHAGESLLSKVRNH